MDEKENKNNQKEPVQEPEEKVTKETTSQPEGVKESTASPQASPEESISAPEEEKIDYEITGEEKLPNSVMKYNLTIKAEYFKEKLESKLKDLKSNVIIPGFRKGKAPMKLVEIQFGESARRETVEELFPQLMKQVVAEKELEVVGEPTLKTFDVAEDGSLNLEAEVEFIPQLELSDDEYKNVEVEIDPIIITDEMVDNYIEDLRWENSILRPKTEDAVFEKGDALIADITVKDEQGNRIEELCAENTLYRRPEKILPEQVVAALAGKRRNDTLEVKVPNERKNQKGEVVSKNDIFSVTIRDIKTVEVPELDDEFAKDLGDYDSLEVLRQKIKERFETAAAEQEKQNVLDKIYGDIIMRHKIELPKGLIARQTRQLAIEHLESLEREGLELPSDMQEKFFDSKAREAVAQLYYWLISREIARRENIQVSEEEINAELERIGQQHGRKALAIRASLERQKQFDDFVEQLKMKKVGDFVLNNAKIKYKSQVTKGVD
ncbi:trigger factor [Candidatus Sumerlaeota bacterium]|nr:trigger factor [Candidatus Sumerlaeota bacterium]